MMPPLRLPRTPPSASANYFGNRQASLTEKHRFRLVFQSKTLLNTYFRHFLSRLKLKAEWMYTLVFNAYPNVFQVITFTYRVFHF